MLRFCARFFAMSKHFGDRLVKAVQEKGSCICVGLDPRLEQIPKHLIDKALKEGDENPMIAASRAILEFNIGIIDAVCDLVPAVKPQIAFYEVFGAAGITAYQETLKYAKGKGLLTIADAKRNDIGSTAEAYAEAYLGETQMFEGEKQVVIPAFDADSITVTPYLGWDGVKPFMDECEDSGKGIFVLVKTSNKSSGDLQDLEIKSGEALYEVMGHLVDSWGADDIGEMGYSFVGAVVGATFPEQAKRLRRIMPNSYFLVPGYGAQGAGAADVKPCFNKDGLGAIVNNSRGIIYAYEKMEGFDEKSFGEAAREACLLMKKDLEQIF